MAKSSIGFQLGEDITEPWCSTVSRIVRIFYTTGDVKKKTYPKDARPNKKLTYNVQLVILHTILQNPGMYLHELQMEVCIATGVQIFPASLCAFLKKFNFTRQKMQLIARQRDDELRKQFTIDVSLYKSDMIVFIDESGCDRRNALRRYGYGVRGIPPKSCQLLVRGERLSAIAAMTTEGIGALRIKRGTVDGETFLDFIERDLLPMLMPFNGINRNSVVILDNCSVHHVSGVKVSYKSQ